VSQGTICDQRNREKWSGRGGEINELNTQAGKGKGTDQNSGTDKTRGDQERGESRQVGSTKIPLKTEVTVAQMQGGKNI